MNTTPDGIRIDTTRNTHETAAELLFQEQDMRDVLDIPCGEGAFTSRLLEKGLTVHAGDCVDGMKATGASFKVCDMNDPLPFDDSQLDAVVSIDGIEHIKRPFDFVMECSRVIRPGGILIVSTPNISALRSRWRWFLTGFHNKCKRPLDEGNPSPRHHINMLSFPSLRYMLHTNSFRITSVQTNRIKPVSWIYAIAVPFLYLVTLRTFLREEKDLAQRERNRELLGQLFSSPVLFGETLVVKAARC